MGQLTDNDIERIKKEAEDNAEADKKEKRGFLTVKQEFKKIYEKSISFYG